MNSAIKCNRLQHEIMRLAAHKLKTNLEIASKSLIFYEKWQETRTFPSVFGMQQKYFSNIGYAPMLGLKVEI
jgi:hypothetical protein